MFYPSKRDRLMESVELNARVWSTSHPFCHKILDPAKLGENKIPLTLLPPSSEGRNYQGGRS